MNKDATIQKLHKKNADLRHQITSLHGKINNLKNRLLLKEKENTELKREIKRLEGAENGRQ